MTVRMSIIDQLLDQIDIDVAKRPNMEHRGIDRDRARNICGDILGLYSGRNSDFGTAFTHGSLASSIGREMLVSLLAQLDITESITKQTPIDTRNKNG